MEPDYTPFDHGTQTREPEDKFYKSPEELNMKREEVLLDLQGELKDEDNIPY